MENLELINILITFINDSKVIIETLENRLNKNIGEADEDFLTLQMGRDVEEISARYTMLDNASYILNTIYK